MLGCIITGKPQGMSASPAKVCESHAEKMHEFRMKVLLGGEIKKIIPLSGLDFVRDARYIHKQSGALYRVAPKDFPRGLPSQDRSPFSCAIACESHIAAHFPHTHSLCPAEPRLFYHTFPELSRGKSEKSE